MTSTNEKLISIFSAFKIFPPTGCMTENQKEGYRRTTNPKPWNRPKGNTNKTKIR